MKLRSVFSTCSARSSPLVLILLELCFGRRICSRIRRRCTFACYLPKIFCSSTHSKQQARTAIAIGTALPFPLWRQESGLLGSQSAHRNN